MLGSTKHNEGENDVFFLYKSHLFWTSLMELKYKVHLKFMIVIMNFLRILVKILFLYSTVKFNFDIDRKSTKYKRRANNNWIINVFISLWTCYELFMEPKRHRCVKFLIPLFLIHSIGEPLIQRRPNQVYGEEYKLWGRISNGKEFLSSPPF